MPLIKHTTTPMPALASVYRVTCFDEVPTGYTLAMAVEEAGRCLQCPDPVCQTGCPVNVPIRDFIGLLAQGRVDDSIRRMVELNRLPAICGRVCPQETQCEERCVLNWNRRHPVSIGRLERFVADWAREHGGPGGTAGAGRSGPAGRVAVVGAGPAGLTCAGDLAALGHRVTVYEALHTPGGVLVYGIPEFRLPKEIVAHDVATLAALGVEFCCNVIVGRTLTIDQLMGEMGFDAVFIATGAGKPRMLGVPGENMCGVFSANEFLTRINLMRADRFPAVDTPFRLGERAAVIGAGNTAMDAVRTARRMGAREAMIIYRRSQAEMTARAEEYEHAVEEGIQFHWLTAPLAVIGDEEGWVNGLACARMELGEPDESGRRRPVQVPGSEFILPVDTVIMALGTTPNPIIGRTTPGLELNRHGCILVDEATGMTSRPGVFAGGDIVTGAATVILAMGAGQRAAAAIDAYVRQRVAAA